MCTCLLLAYWHCDIILWAFASFLVKCCQQTRANGQVSSQPLQVIKWRIKESKEQEMGWDMPFSVENLLLVIRGKNHKIANLIQYGRMELISFPSRYNFWTSLTDLFNMPVYSLGTFFGPVLVCDGDMFSPASPLIDMHRCGPYKEAKTCIIWSWCYCGVPVWQVRPMVQWFRNELLHFDGPCQNMWGNHKHNRFNNLGWTIT